VSRPQGSNPPTTEADPVGYTVVARRYRPQRFEDVVGQDHVVQALRNAIRLNRVTHAYLFSGTRGVGKTSIARIFAKCLNCVHGPTEDPDQTCDICRSISIGQDVDVIEIDGASNNGVEQVRELRQNAGLRPSRSRFKIYYIDEVHMLSTGAFNALLKTLEEPPPHVKFFFATTEPNKIPITVLSRCQRYDFAGITPDQITSTLAEICTSENVKADPEALGVIARRAGGSMRDAQSLLEQLLSFGGERLTVELVQQQLGIASDDRTLDLLDALSRRDAAEALRIVDQTASGGVQPTELLAGALEFLRDVMITAVSPDLTLHAAAPRQKPRLREIADRWSTDTLLAALQVFSEARQRLRGSSHGRTLVEIAVLRVARLENLGELDEVVARLAALESGAPPVSVVEKKKLTVAEPREQVEPVVVSEPAKSEPIVLSGPSWDLGAISAAWASWASSQSNELATKLASINPVGLEGSGLLVIEPAPGYNWLVDVIERGDLKPKLEAGLCQWLERRVIVRFRKLEEPSNESANRHASVPSRNDRLLDDPLHKLIVERFEARAVRVEADDEPDSSES
jgi:DNA polymerase-3 subunit gamma/tau